MVTNVQLICLQVVNDLLTIIEVGQQRSRMTRLITVSALLGLWQANTNFS